MGPRKTILLIESDPHLRAIISIAFELEWHVVLEVANAQEAFEVISTQSRAIDAILYNVTHSQNLNASSRLLSHCFDLFGKCPTLITAKDSSKLLDLREFQELLTATASA